MNGKLYGIGIGPGDPGLMTLKAKEVLDKADVIAYPVRTRGENGTAVSIVGQVVDLSEKRVVELLFSMNPDLSVRRRCRAEALDELCSILGDGNDVAMITLGDVAVYSTYMYIDSDVRARGFETEIIPGIPSFCDGAARARLPLMIGEESLSVVSMAKDNVEKAETVLDASDNVVFMKAFSAIGDIAEMMAERDIPLENATVFSNIGMDDEYIGPLDPDRKYGYFTTVLLKKRRD